MARSPAGGAWRRRRRGPEPADLALAGYEPLVSKIDTGDSEDRPDWMGKVDLGGLKLKLIGTIVAISGIHLLKSFMNIEQTSKEELLWLIIVHLTFVASGMLYAVMDWLAAKAHLTMAQVDAAHGGGGKGGEH